MEDAGSATAEPTAASCKKEIHMYEVPGVHTSVFGCPRICPAPSPSIRPAASSAGVVVLGAESGGSGLC